MLPAEPVSALRNHHLQREFSDGQVKLDGAGWWEVRWGCLKEVQGEAALPLPPPSLWCGPSSSSPPRLAYGVNAVSTHQICNLTWQVLPTLAPRVLPASSCRCQAHLRDGVVCTDLSARVRFEPDTIYCKHPSLCVTVKENAAVWKGSE